MKTLINTLFIISASIILTMLSCQKEIPLCHDVEYNKAFKIEKNNKYCFNDGNYFVVENMSNGFCPCNSECKWEGEMTLFYSTSENGVIVTKTVGSSEKTDSMFITNKRFIRFLDIGFVEPCSSSNPFPDIKNVTILVTNE